MKIGVEGNFLRILREQLGNLPHSDEEPDVPRIASAREDLVGHVPDNYYLFVVKKKTLSSSHFGRQAKPFGAWITVF